ncbi:coproporphyrinogen-III oxidase family protein [Thermococcus indicus]|nr:coproporphyrinogen-III oxidase family protein [Thermococcus indicus]
MKWVKTHHSALSPLRRFKKPVEVSLPKLYRNRKGFVYVHVPFCLNNCRFCILYREKPSVPLDSYVNAVKRELQRFKSFKAKVVYFGGGTPTLLSGEQLGEIIDSIRGKSRPKEITVETTVREFTREKAEELVSLGVNRVSFGIQTFNEKKRLFLGRKSGLDEIIKKIELAREHFIVSIDLLYDLPYGNTLIDDIRTAIELGVDGLSIYPLEHTGYTKDYPHPSVEENERDFLKAYEILRENGYGHINMNHFTSGKDEFLYSRVFTRPWIPLLGIGCGAGGHVDFYQTFHPPGVRAYIQNPYRVMIFASESFEVERFLSGLFEGELELGECGLEEFPSLKLAIEKGWGVFDGNGFRLTPRGLFWANTLAYMMCLDYLRNRFCEFSSSSLKTESGEVV